MWKKLVGLNHGFQNQRQLRSLNVSLTRDDVMGESMYNHMLSTSLLICKHKALARVWRRTSCIPRRIQKQRRRPDGRYRAKTWRWLPVHTDIACVIPFWRTGRRPRTLLHWLRQRQHLMQAWTIVRKAGYVPESVSLGTAFGMMLVR